MTRRRGAPPHERACRLGAGCRCARPPPGSPLRSDPAPRGAGGDLDPVSAHRRGAITGSRPRPATQLARHDHDENRPGRLHLSKARFWSERWGPPQADRQMFILYWDVGRRAKPSMRFRRCPLRRSLKTVVAALRVEQQDLEERVSKVRRAIEALSAADDVRPRPGRTPKAAKKPRKKMSAAAKKAISERMKKSWAKRKRAARKRAAS